MFSELTDEIKTAGAKLVAVSKTQSNEAITALYKSGQRIFGENRVQEMIPKHEALPKDIEWHQIGHLQTNKVKSIAPFVAMIHSVDSLRLLLEIEKEAVKNNRKIDVLLQFHIASEDSKYGMNYRKVRALLEDKKFKTITSVNIRGVMGMATYTEDDTLIRSEFRDLKKIFDKLKRDYFQDKEDFTEISMGMSSDYKIALNEGTTMVRIGSLLFS